MRALLTPQPSLTEDGDPKRVTRREGEKEQSCPPRFSREGPLAAARQCGVSLVSLLLFASCTAIDQKDAYLDALPRVVDNVVFRDDFENGLGGWSQTSGVWTVSNSGGVSGNYLQSGTSASAATFNIATVNNLNLTGRTNCVLEYDARFLIKGVSGVSATVLFDTTTVGTFKDTSGLNDITSSAAFVHRKALLPDNGYGRLSFVTNVTNDTTGFADLRIDNVSVTCNNAPSTAVTVAYENLDSSAANWSLQSPWARTAGVGYGGSAGLQLPVGTTGGSGNGGNWLATFLPIVNLTNRFGCRLEFYYSVSAAGNNCLYLEMNGSKIWTLCGASSVGNISTSLTAFEGVSSNSIAYRCLDANVSGGGSVTCLVDEFRLTCQQ